MKILAIRGKNLASLEDEFEIDFTKEPLNSAGIFTITGNTGSGKSTILDALCLALFDNTPRTNRAGENISIPDVKEKTINQRDSRTILRRGTGEGYAEVDFVSLGGEKFRSTWMVKRARGKADGSLQTCEMRLINLSTQTEVTGKRTELLSRIVQLIGLSFDQFTRAVLLAQGDFATFLKAKQAEKAELLEKLTGTDIYSRISVTIYEKTKEAEQSLKLLEERIKDIELLSDEQIETLTTEKSTIMQELVALRNSSTILSEKMKWIKQDKILRKDREDAESMLKHYQTEIEKAKPRYEYMARIESVQEIRDNFNEWQQTKKQLITNQLGLTENEQKQQTNILQLEKSNKLFDLLEKEQQEHEQLIADIEPEIIKARALDVEIKSAKTNQLDANEEYKTAVLTQEKSGKSVAFIKEQIQSTQQSIEKLSLWFDQNKAFAEIAPRTDLIINLLNDAAIVNTQLINNKQLVSKNQEILVVEKKQLEVLKQETERLNKLLPAEIAKLRANLQPGCPCPVCGSIHHSLQDESEISRLEEEELNKSKNENEKKIIALVQTIEERKNTITRLETLIESYTTQSVDSLKKVNTYLAYIPAWKELFAQGRLQEDLKRKTDLWNNNHLALSQKQNENISLVTNLQNEEKNVADAIANSDIKKKKLKDLETVLSQLSEQRKGIINGKPADEVTRYYTNKKQKLANKIVQATKERQVLTLQNETYKGIISQINNEIIRLTQLSSQLGETIDNWIKEKKDITHEQLMDLLSKDSSWLTAERQYLNSLKETETAAKATLAERNKNFALHNKANIQPESEDENLTFLETELVDKNKLIEQKMTRNTEIEFSFSNHTKGKECIKSFEKELTKKQESTNNWKKLNEMFGSATGSKFKEIAQGYTLDALLTYANKHLQQLSERYKLQRIPNTLALQVIDLDMLNEVRTVHSLSGGESFLVSLALALGLSSLSSNRMKIESLFIDEGFGSLDMDTLRIAMDALERLQNQGRKIGVISHVEEMTERIPAQIRVLKSANGKSYIAVMSK